MLSKKIAKCLLEWEAVSLYITKVRFHAIVVVLHSYTPTNDDNEVNQANFKETPQGSEGRRIKEGHCDICETSVQSLLRKMKVTLWVKMVLETEMTTGSLFSDFCAFNSYWGNVFPHTKSTGLTRFHQITISLRSRWIIFAPRAP